MKLSDITPIILTYNEESNIGRCLNRLKWAKQVLIVDSGSDDGTVAVTRKFSNVELITRSFDDHTTQWNYGVSHCATPWVLALDADYILSEDFEIEIAELDHRTSVVAFGAKFAYCIHQRRLRGTLYPPRHVLFAKDYCKYVRDGHTQVLEANGSTRMLNAPILHDDRKPLTRWLDSQRKYATLEAQKLLKEKGSHGVADRLRIMIWPAAPAAFLYTLFCKGLILNGWPGLFYALQRTYAELLLSMEILERKLKD